MPFTNAKCEYCNEVKDYVFENYECVSGSTIELRKHPFANQIIPKAITFICKDCEKKEK